MRKVTVSFKSKIKRNETSEGKSIERMLSDKAEGELIELGGKALLYTERKDGVVPITNIRSDRMELAMEALDTVERTRIARRDAPAKVEEVAQGGKPSETTQGTTE
ncbi:hypothetical protein [Tortoise microvirus 19]|nr:hypothetical protein [Tortoise microvirus 19]